MSSQALVSIGLVTWNSAAYLPACLTAVARQTYPACELIVVDNASNDASLLCFSFHPAPVVIHKNLSNLGFAHAQNQAIRFSRGRYYLALNPDVIMEADYVSALVDVLDQNPEAGMAGGKLLLDLSRIDSTGLFFDRKRRQHLRGHGELDQGQYDRPGEVFGIDGAAPLYRRTMIDDVSQDSQFFDESFVTYKEDLDVAWRARLLGWRAWYTPVARATHQRTFRPGQRQRGSRETRRFSVRNRYLMMIKNETSESWRHDWLHILAYDFGIISYLLLFEQTSLAAIADVYRLWPTLRRRRAEIMRTKRVVPNVPERWFQ